MDIRSLLIEGHNKEQASYICDQIIIEPYLLRELLDLFYSDNMRLRQRASFPLEFLGKRNENLLHPYLPEMISLLHQENIHDSLPRNIFRIWQHMSFNEEVIGEVFDVSFAYLSNPKNAIAVKVFAMSTCSRIAQIYPALSIELIPIIEEQYPHGSTGFKNRAAKELKILRTLSI